MFQSEVEQFIVGNNNVNSAKTLINECKRLILDMDFETAQSFKSLKNNVNGCKIDSLATKIDETKARLMELEGFSDEYCRQLQEILSNYGTDTSQMSDEELMQYDMYQRDYAETILDILEKYEAEGRLTEELQAELPYWKAMVARNDLQEQMSVLREDTQEFIDLYNQLAECDRNLIKFNPNLTEEEKSAALTQFEANYNENLKMLTEAKEKREKEQADREELNNLEAAKANNNGFWHPFVEDEYNEAILNKRIEMGIATEDEIAYKNMNSWDRFCVDTETFATTTFIGAFDVIETVGDGFVMVGSSVGICDKDWATEFVSIDYSGETYEGMQLMYDMNTYSATGDVAVVGNFIGNTLGYAGISFLPGGKIVTGAVGGLSAMGSSSERAINSGATYGEALISGYTAGALGFGTGYWLGNFNKVSSVKTVTLKQAGGNIIKGGLISSIEPVANSVIDYNLYAGEMLDENGNNVYDNWWDYYVSSGGALNTVMAFGAGGFSSGTASYKGYKINQAGTKQYKRFLSASMEDEYRYKTAKSTYDAFHGEGEFDKLSDLAQFDKMYSIDEEALLKKMLENDNLINNSANNAMEQYKAGVFDSKKYTLADVFAGYGEDQRQFWSDKAYADYKNDFGKYVDNEGNIKVYCFQNGTEGANNIVKFKGNTSLPEGSFVMSERQYLELLADRTIFDDNGVCISPEKLTNVTGGVPFGDGKQVIAVEQTVKLDDITIPNGSHPNAYLGWFSQGGKTVTVEGKGYCIEGIAPYNNYANGNVNVISHSSGYSNEYYANLLTK